jgi:hypothetical protein
MDRASSERHPAASAAGQSGLLESLYGIASEIFRELGGGEKFIREEREKLNFRYGASGDEEF